MKGKHCEICVSFNPCASCICTTCAKDSEGCCESHFGASCDTRNCPDYVAETDNAKNQIPPPVKMTLSQICATLGYDVELVEEDANEDANADT